MDQGYKPLMWHYTNNTMDKTHSLETLETSLAEDSSSFNHQMVEDHPQNTISWARYPTLDIEI